MPSIPSWILLSLCRFQWSSVQNRLHRAGKARGSLCSCLSSRMLIIKSCWLHLQNKSQIWSFCHSSVASDRCLVTQTWTDPAAFRGESHLSLLLLCRTFSTFREKKWFFKSKIYAILFFKISTTGSHHTTKFLPRSVLAWLLASYPSFVDVLSRLQETSLFAEHIGFLLPQRDKFLKFLPILILSLFLM